MLALSKVKDERIVELTKKIANLKDVETSNKSLSEKMRFLETSMNDESKLVRCLKSKEGILIKELEQGTEKIQKIANDTKA